MPHGKRAFFITCALAVLLSVAGAQLATRLLQPAENRVLAEVRTNQHALDGAVRGALDNQLEQVSALLEAAAELPSIRDSSEALVSERLTLLGPLVPRWVDLFCVLHRDGAPPHCVTREAGVLTVQGEFPLVDTPPTQGVALVPGEDGRTTIVLRRPLEPAKGQTRRGGELVALGQLSRLLHETLHVVSLPGEMEVEVYREDGTILHHPNPSYLGRTWEQIEGEERPLNNWSAQEEGEEEAARRSFLSPHPGWARYVNQNAGAQTLLARHGPVASLPGLHLVLSRRLGEVDTALHTNRMWVAGTGALVTVPVVLMLYFWYRRRGELPTALGHPDRLDSQLQVVLDSVGAWIYITDGDRKIVRANRRMREDLRRMGENDPVGRPCKDIFGGAVCSECPSGASPDSSGVCYFEARVRDRLLAMSVRQMPSTGGGMEALHTAEDIGESKRIRTALEESERRSAAVLLAGSIGHEINNLVTGLAAYAEMLERRADDPQFCRKVGGIFAGQLDRVVLLSRNLLSSSKVPKPFKSPTDLTALFQDTVERLQTSGLFKPFEVQTQWHPLPSVVCDPGQIDQALTNLLVNAGQAMGNVGVLHLRTIQRDGHAILEVRDTGPGLDPDRAERIFDPFYTTKGEKGTGLGLYVTRQIADAHGGRIEVASSPGRGSRFSLLLPLG